MNAREPFTCDTPSQPDDGQAAPDMRAADIAQLEDLQAMAMCFANWLHQEGAEQMESGGEKSAAEVRQLSHSFNRAARAVRQIVVLKQEVAELRPMPGSRPGVPANQNQLARRGQTHNKHGSLYRAPGDRSDLNDLTDDERKELEKDANTYLETLIAALDEDIAAAGPDMVEKARGQSIATKLSVIAAGIPHPKLDSALAKIEMAKLWKIFAPKYIANRALGPPPPGGWPADEP
jgi:hypothetical protein